MTLWVFLFMGCSFSPLFALELHPGKHLTTAVTDQSAAPGIQFGHNAFQSGGLLSDSDSPFSIDPTWASIKGSTSSVTVTSPKSLKFEGEGAVYGMILCGAGTIGCTIGALATYSEGKVLGGTACLLGAAAFGTLTVLMKKDLGGRSRSYNDW